MRKTCLSTTGILLLLLATLGSCQSLEQISIDYLQPAGLTFPPNLRKVGIVNNTSATPDQKLITEEKKPDYHRGETKKVIGYAYGDAVCATEALAQDIADQNYFETVVICDSALRADDILERERRLSPQEVEKLASDLKVDFIVALESVLLKTTELVSYEPDLDWFSGSIDLKAFSTFSVYVPGRNTPMSTQTPSDSIFWEDYGGTAIEASQLMPPDSRILVEGSHFAGTVPTRYLAPMWKTGIRYLYTGSTAPMRDAMVYARQNSWDKAYEQWKYAFDHTKKIKRKMKAAFNIALCYEMRDNFDQAEEWALKAKEIIERIDRIEEQKKTNVRRINASSDYYLITQYIGELKKRKAAAPKLNLQMQRFSDDF